MTTTAMILAAGRGERMGKLTELQPKPLIKLCGKSLILWQIDKLVEAGIQNIVINLAYRGEQIAQALGDGSDWGVKIVYSYEAEALETAGGIIQALDLIVEDEFLVVNADVWCDWNYSNLVDLPLKGDCHLYLVDNPQHNRGGDFSLNADLLIDSPKYTFSGIGKYNKAGFLPYAKGRRNLASVIRDKIKQGRAVGSLQIGQWVDVGTPQRLAELEQQLSNREF